jgi:hypothetical protein
VGLAFFPKEDMAYRQNNLARKDAGKEKPPPVPLSDRFPVVSGIVFHMTYYQKEAANSVLMLRTVNFYPNSDSNFHMQCMIKDCEEGGFDLSKTVANMVKRKKKAAKGNMLCSGKNEALSLDHASISYEIAIKYKRTLKKSK